MFNEGQSDSDIQKAMLYFILNLESCFNIHVYFSEWLFTVNFKWLKNVKLGFYSQLSVIEYVKMTTYS